jgi:mediator of RNA polymerase II transcription subunit 12, fungi type
VNRGLQRISEALNRVNNNDKQALASLSSKAGHFLNLISMITRPLRHASSHLPKIDVTILDVLVSAISDKFNSLRELLEASALDVEQKIPNQNLTDAVLFSARLIHFILGFPDVWTPKMKEKGKEMLTVAFRMAILYSGGVCLDMVAFPLLLDTNFYLLDGKKGSFC